MKKSKLSLSLVTSLLSVAALTGCDGATYSPEGYILTYTNSSGETINYTADDLFDNYYQESSSLSTVFDKVYKLVVRNYFEVEAKGIEKYVDIEQKAKNDVDGVKKTAEQNAETNNTSYDDEFDSLLSSYGCEDEDELLEHFIYERELTEFEDQFYDDNIDHLRDSKSTDTTGDKYSGYLEKKLPYHVRHILVKVSESSSTSYWNATISEDNARSLYDVANALSLGQSFGSIAKQYSDDGSSDSYGDLGIMDLDTSYVNEFKLGIYAFENLYNSNSEVSTNVTSSNIAMSDDIKNEYESAVDYADAIMSDDTDFGFATVPYGVFDKLLEYSNVTTDENNSSVNDGSSTFYPRNIMFNKYLNKHSLAFITPNVTNNPTTNWNEILLEDTTGTLDSEYEARAGFKEFTFKTKDGNTATQKVLTSSTGAPILVARAGTSDYQGIHFITIERDALIDTENGVSLSNYYTTKYPGQAGYPTDDNGQDLSTYVNFLDQETKDYKSRAETVESKIKGFDSNLSKYIFNKYLESEKVKIKNEDLSKNLQNWMDKAIEKTNRDSKISWDETWESYIHSLEQQKVERQKLISETCAIGYLNSAKGDEWTKIGGLCNDNKTH